MLKMVRLCLPCVIIFVLGSQIFAADNGQDDLDKATDAKLNANTISDLGEVVSLTESALKKGLDDSNTTFAKKLLASTCIQRAQETVKQIVAGVTSADDFRKKRDFAVSDLEKAVKVDPSQAEGHLLLGQLNLLPGGDLKIAKRCVEKALELGIDEPASHAKALMLRAAMQEDFAKRLPDLDEAVRLAPNDSAVVRARGLLLADLNKLDQAAADLKKAIELDEDEGSTYEAYAIVLARLKRFDESLVALDKAHQLSPQSVMPLVHRARVHSTQEKKDAALDDLNMALAIEPDNVAVLLMRASIYQEKGEKQKAMADADQAVKLKPDLPVALRTRAMLLVDADRFDEAVAELEKICKIEPNDPITLLQLAVLYSAQKKPAKAIETYTAALAIEPDDFRALRGRGDTYLNIGKQAEAIADYEKALKAEDDDQNVLNNLAWVLATSPNENIRNGRRAVELATKACKLTDYKQAYILSTLAAAYAETEDFQNALKWSAKAVELGEKEHQDSLKKELESYKAKKPWRELLSNEKPAAK